MTKLRYKVYDLRRGRWLERYSVVGENVLTKFTHHREKAMLFPGAKTARRVCRIIGGECAVINAKGVEI